MANETQENGSTDETSGQGQQGQQQAPTGETPGNGEQQQATTPVIDKDTKLPDDHPLVKTLAANKEKISSQASALAEAQAQSAKATQLEEELNARPTQEALDTLQTRYDRLEAFLTAAGGPIGKALDSRTFTRDLFESDRDITALVKDWHKANPTATSQALSSAAGGEGSDKKSPNELLRIAAGKA